MTYRIEQTDNRVSAIDPEGREICGAFNPVGHTYWILYVTQLVSALTGQHAPPHREYFYGDRGRKDVTAWITLIATLYSFATQAVTV